jgi:hypothetical protein
MRLELALSLSCDEARDALHHPLTRVFAADVNVTVVRIAKVTSGTNGHNPLVVVGFRQNLSECRLQFLGRELHPSSTIAFPFGEASSTANRVLSSINDRPSFARQHRSRTRLHFLICILDGCGLRFERSDD